MSTLSISERLWSKIDKRGPDECWLWTASTDTRGYGQIHASPSKWVRAHRAVYEECVGLIPKGMCVLHRCDNRRCCNPEHLWLGTVRDNNKDRDQKRRNGDTRGEKHGMVKLTNADVRRIRNATGTLKEIGDTFGVTPQNIFFIRKRRTWRHV